MVQNEVLLSGPHTITVEWSIPAREKMAPSLPRGFLVYPESQHSGGQGVHLQFLTFLPQ